MPNTYFSFKQFTVHQQHCAMKVCTDACLFGAWVAQWLNSQGQVKNVLDIGAGTGLLSLMLAQQCPATIQAIELDKKAAMQCRENFAASPWQHRLEVWEGNVLTHPIAQAYDLIICNPPFFENDLKAAQENRNMAMHSSSLTLELLVQKIKSLLKPTGCAALLLPYSRQDEAEKLFYQNALYPHRAMYIKQTTTHPFFRSQYLVGMQPSQMQIEQMAIKNESNQYSEPFTTLLKNYYLYL